MNSEAIQSAVTKLVAMLLTALCTHYFPSDANSSYLPAIAAGAGALAAFGWSVYQHYGMKKVPQAATAIEVTAVQAGPVTSAGPVAGAVVTGKVVG